MERPFESSPPIPDPSSAPFPSFPMPMPVINVQMPSADAPYGQPCASEYPYASEPPYAHEPSYTSEPSYDSEPQNASEPPCASEYLVSEHSYTPEHPYPFQQSQQPYHAPHISVSLYHTEPPLEPWVPKLPGPSGEEEVDPTAEPVCIPAPEQGASILRRPSRLQRLASFLRLRPKESTTSRHS